MAVEALVRSAFRGWGTNMWLMVIKRDRASGGEVSATRNGCFWRRYKLIFVGSYTSRSSNAVAGMAVR